MILKYQEFFEKLVLSNYDEYMKLVAKAYDDAESYDKSEIYRWKSLSNHAYKMFKRLSSKIDVVFSTIEEEHDSHIEIDGVEYKLITIVDDINGPYKSYEEMLYDVNTNKVLKVSIDYSDHPVFTVEDNIVLRTVHDYIVHILSGVDFTGKGEIAAFNAHAKMAPPDAIPAIFTEVVGQASYFITHGKFPEQKIVVLDGFDFDKVGFVDGYDVVGKKLRKTDETFKKI